MKEKVEVAISTTMGYPIVHFKLLDNVRKESNENFKSLRLEEELPLIDFLYVKILVDWYLNYKRFIK